MPQLIAGAVSSVLTSLGVGAAAAASLSQLATGLLLSVAQRALLSRNSQSQSAELSGFDAAPDYRHVYGECRAMASPLANPVKGLDIWGAWLLNSRPSALPSVTLKIDKRTAAHSGDPFDFAGPGASVTSSPFDTGSGSTVRFWVGRGGQTAPPAEYLADAAQTVDRPDLWLSSDGFRGLTVLFVKVNSGKRKQMAWRWKSTPPVFEVEGRWSKVWDPRDGAQSATDPATWAWSENHALCALDAHRMNPVREWLLPLLDIASFEDGADICDEVVALKSGGTEKRYRAAGTLTYDRVEIEDILEPLIASGAARLASLGGRRIYVPGAWQAPDVTVTDFFGDDFEVTDLLPAAEIANELRVSYLSPERGFETAYLEPWAIPGALAADGNLLSSKPIDLPFCPSATQAMRIRQIEARRMRRQERIDGAVLPPEAFNLVPGGAVTLALAAPFNVLNGIYEAEAVNPHFDPLGEDGGVALRIPASLVKTAASVYDWTAATDEEDVILEPYNGAQAVLAAPGALSVTTGPGIDLDTGGTVIPRLRFAASPSASTRTTGYEWEHRDSGGDWRPGGTIDGEVRDGTGKVFGFVQVGFGSTTDLRMRAVAPDDETSDWTLISGVVVTMQCSGVTGSAGLGSATISGTAPASVQAVRARVYRTTGTTFNTATPVSPAVAITPGAAFAITAGDATRANLFTNADFAAGATGWTLDADWSIGSGVATKVAGASAASIRQAPTMTAGDVLRVRLEVTAITAGNMRLRAAGTPNADSASRGTVGVLLSTLTVPASPTSLQVVGTNVTAGSVDDAVAYVQTAACLAQGQGYFWVCPESATGVLGTPSGPFDLTII